MENKIRRIGVLTSGGDAPGMNAAVRAVARTAIACGMECIGIRRGWQGLITSDFVQLDAASVGHILSRGGTILYTARSEDFMSEKGRKRAVSTCKMLGIDVSWQSAATAPSAVRWSCPGWGFPPSACRRPSTTTSAAPTIPLASTPPVTPP